MRPIALGRERLEARARHLPTPQELLAGPAQALDEVGDRLRRGLGDRVVLAARQYQTVSGRLSLPLLSARLSAARQRLEGQRLAPALLQGRIAQDRARLDGLGRVLQSLNPDGILQKGYVRVTGADGRTLVSAQQAREATRLTLHFRDGQLNVAPLDGAAPRPAPRPTAAKPRPAMPEQGKLL